MGVERLAVGLERVLVGLNHLLVHIIAHKPFQLNMSFILKHLNFITGVICYIRLTKCARRYSVGVIPVCFLKKRMK